MGKLSEILKEDARHIWSKILTHPFIIELYEGTLPLKKFKFYVKQDYTYLIGSMKAFSLLASKASYEISKLALELAYADATVEMENYIKLLKKLDMDLNYIMNEDPAPTNLAYVNFLLSTCCLGSSLECLVSLLPCFWSYQEIAEYNKDKLFHNHVDIYVEWAKVYLSKEYKSIVSKLKKIIDLSWKGNNYEKYKRVFLTASRYEYMFWDMAYKIEGWPI